MSISRLEFIYIHFSRQDFRLRNSVILASFAKSRKVYEVFFFAIAYFSFCKKLMLLLYNTFFCMSTTQYILLWVVLAHNVYLLALDKCG